MADSDTLLPEWSCRVEVGHLSSRIEKRIEADAQQRKDLTRRLQVRAIDDLTADFTLEPTGSGNLIHVSGIVRGLVTQPCTVTAVDVIQQIDEPFDAYYADRDAFVVLARARHDRLAKRLDAEVPMLEEHEDPEPIIDGRIDLGELATQYLSLAVDPFPHAPDVMAQGAEAVLKEKGVVERKPNPFAALKAWKAARGTVDKD